MTMNSIKEERNMTLPPKIGVTGAAGFIGANLVERLLDEGCSVIGVDDMSMGTLRNLAGLLDHPNFTFEQFDCRDAARMREAMGDCDAIAHMAALKIPRYGGALKTLHVNVDGSHVALQLGLEIGAHVVLASTSDVYGMATPPFAEDDPIVLGPPTTRRWSYAASKIYDEHLALRMAEEEGLKVTILRFFNAYGARNHPSWWGGPLSVFFEDLLDGREMELHGDGRQTRSFTYVSDTVDGVVRALERPETSGEVINVGNDQPIAIVDLARKVQDVDGHRRARCAPTSSRWSRSAATTRTSGTACRTCPRPSASSASSRRCRSRRAWRKTLAWHLELREEAAEAVEVA